MSHYNARTGDGAAWLVADRDEPVGFHCYWYKGPAEDHLVEHAYVGAAPDAVAWGRRRARRVRIRTADARTSWAGSDPRPAGIVHTWIDPELARGAESC